MSVASDPIIVKRRKYCVRFFRSSLQWNEQGRPIITESASSFQLETVRRQQSVAVHSPSRCPPEAAGHLLTTVPGLPIDHVSNHHVHVVYNDRSSSLPPGGRLCVRTADSIRRVDVSGWKRCLQDLQHGVFLHTGFAISSVPTATTAAAASVYI